jgi:hypothetical protein
MAACFCPAFIRRYDIIRAGRCESIVHGYWVCGSARARRSGKAHMEGKRDGGCCGWRTASPRSSEEEDGLWDGAAERRSKAAKGQCGEARIMRRCCLRAQKQQSPETPTAKQRRPRGRKGNAATGREPSDQRVHCARLLPAIPLRGKRTTMERNNEIRPRDMDGPATPPPAAPYNKRQTS